jgi:glycosyltransferase involved in cell wall biosynthesis
VFASLSAAYESTKPSLFDIERALISAEEKIMSPRRKKILFIIQSLSVGGAEKVLINLVNHFNRSQFIINVITLSNRNPLAREIYSDDIHFTPLPRKWRYDMRPAQQIRQIIIENQIDTVIAFDLLSFFYIWYAFLRIPLKPRIYISLHSTTPKNLKHFLQTMLVLRLLSGEEKFISVCDAQADYLSKVYGIPRKRFATVYNGVDIEYFHPLWNIEQRNSIRSSLMIPDNAFVILQVASLAPHKRHEDSLAALKNFVDRNPSLLCYLLFVGQGPKDRERKLEKLAESLSISNLVKFCGLQSDVRPFYQATDIFTLSSQFIETFSVAALEAMSMGLPCVLTEVGGASEMIVEGMNGYLVPARNPPDLANAWLKVLKNKDAFDHEKIRAWVIEHFTLKECVSKYENILR